MPVTDLHAALSLEHLSAFAGEAGRVGRVGDIVLRRDGDGEVFVSDGGHWICDCVFGKIPDLGFLSIRWTVLPG